MNYKEILAMAAAYKEVAEGKASKAKSLGPEDLEEKKGPCWTGHERVPGTTEGEPGSCRKKGTTKEDASNDKSDDGEGLDKVDAKANKKKFADRKDKDIDNDGDTDSSDEFLHKRRKAISKSMKRGNKAEVETETQESTNLGEKLTAKQYMDYDKPENVAKRAAARKAGGMKPNATGKAILNKEEVELDEAPRRKGAPKITGDYVAIQRAKDAAHNAAMGRTKTGRKKPVRTMTSTQRSLASMRENDESVVEMTTAQKNKFDVLFKKMDGGPEHKALMSKFGNPVKANDAFHSLVMKKVMNEENIDESQDHGNMDNGSPQGEGLSPSAKKELAKKTPMLPATDEPAVTALNFKTFKAMTKKAAMRSGDNDSGDKTSPKNDGK